MCAVIGLDLTNPDLDLVRELFLQSQIRGKHATGVTYYKQGKLTTIKEDKPPEEFFKKISGSENDIDKWVDGDRLLAIGHCRYSTSDLKYNQPISNDQLSIVHNGVVSQELPESWLQLYGISTETKNDSELLLHTILEGKDPLIEWESSSISMISIDNKGDISYTRNGKRPLWVWKDSWNTIITSTKDIAVRSGLSGSKRVDFDGDDLQP